MTIITRVGYGNELTFALRFSFVRVFVSTFVHGIRSGNSNELFNKI